MSGVWVGVPTEGLTEADLTDVFVSRLGGAPVWLDLEDSSFSAPPKDLKCKACKGDLYLVAQAYAPLDNLERVLYVFACNNAACKNVPGSWAAFRGQIHIHQGGNQAKQTQSQTAKVTATFAEADWDDFGEDESSNTDNNAPQVQNITVTSKDNNNNNNNNSNNNNAKSKDNSSKGDGKNGATSVAQLESMLNQMNTSDAQNQAKKKKKKNKNKNKKVDAKNSETTPQQVGQANFPGFYLDIFEEPIPEKKPLVIEELDDDSESELAPNEKGKDKKKGKSKGLTHEEQLYRQYLQMQKAGESLDNEDFGELEDETSGALGDGNTICSDKTFMKFQKVMDNCPEQAIRWKFNGEPVWISTKAQDLPGLSGNHTLDAKTVNSKLVIPPCSCGKPRVFEMQILPTTVFYLKPGQHTSIPGNEGLDFGTAAVYTCSAKCSVNKYLPEFIHVQPPQ